MDRPHRGPAGPARASGAAMTADLFATAGFGEARDLPSRPTCIGR
jgi:hypothetical protein